MSRDGWHLPSEAEWRELTDYLGGSEVAGGKLKATGTVLWHDPNTDATNETGFTALPGGIRHILGAFDSFGYYGFWWSVTGYNTEYAWSHYIYYDYSDLRRHISNKVTGISVRCVRD